jgi:L-fucose isomerase-like protein
MSTKVKVIFPACAPGEPSWPYIDYDVKKKRDEVLAALGRHVPEIEFSAQILHNMEEAEQFVQKEDGRLDGYLVYMSALWTRIEQVFARKVRPVIIADDLYAGSGGILLTHSMIQKEHLPVVTIASSDLRDTFEAVRLFNVMRKLREARILVVTNQQKAGDGDERVEPLGTTVVRLGSEQLNAYYNAVDRKAARPYQEQWINEAVKMVEPDSEEVLKSARMHAALKAAMRDAGADAVTVDCLGLYYADKLPAYPCLSFFQLNNEGSTGVCEADVDSTLSQLMLRYLTGRPGYVSDPVIDPAANQVVYAHCVATNRVFGPDGASNPYIIRSHAEDGKGASVQSLMPLGEIVTSIKINPREKCFAIHNGRTVANVDDDKACRTKLAAEVDAQTLLDNYHFELFSWHRVTCYGDYRKSCLNLARLYDLQIHEEDRRQYEATNHG